MRKRSVSSARGARAAASARRTQRKIDFSDIPDSSAGQLKAMRRVGRPPLGDEPRRLIAIRVDPGVLDRSARKRAAAASATRRSSTRCWREHVRKDVASVATMPRERRAEGTNALGLLAR